MTETGSPDTRDDRPTRHYVGTDRRAAALPLESTKFGVLAGMFCGLLGAWAFVQWAALTGHGLPASIDEANLARLFDTTAAVVATVAAAMAFIRWRLLGEATSLWVGSGILVYGLITLTLGELIPLVYPNAQQVPLLSTLRPASLLVAMTLVAVGAFAPTVDTRLRPSVVFGSALGLVGAMSAVLLFLPGTVSSIQDSEGQVGLAVFWGFIAALHIATGVRRNRRQHIAVGTMSLGLGLAALAVGITQAAGHPIGAGPAFLRFFALSLVLGGGTRDIQVAFCVQRSRLLDQEVKVETVNAIRRAEHAAHEERAHDARNALFAIDGAAQTLERYRDRLDPDQRTALSEAVSEEIARLQRLISAEHSSDDISEFDVSALVAPILTTERARGTRFEVDLPESLRARGRPAETAEVIRNLLDNARRYAPGSPITVRAAVDGDWAALYVEDRGRGIDRSERDAIFERGHRGSASGGTEGSGLGLFVSRRLMLEQGGDLWVERRKGGGASFGLCLPLAPEQTTASAPLKVVSGRGSTQPLEEAIQ